MAVIGSQNRPADLLPRLKFAILLVFLAFSVLGARLWYLQVVRGEDYFRFAVQNSFKTREVPAPRGIIYGQRGVRIADVRPSFDIIIRPAYIPRTPRDRRGLPPTAAEPLDIRHVAQRLNLLLDMDATLVEERYYAAVGRERYRPVVIKGDVTREEIALIEAHRIDLPGVDILVSQKRTYPYGELFSHLVGYLGEVREGELARLRDEFADEHGEDYYELGDYIGKYGVERSYESWLKGHDGIYYVQEDASGRVVAQGDEVSESDYARAMLAYLEQKRRPEIPGNDLHLTVDVELQAHVREALGSKPGAVVALDPHTGRVLAMVNSPSFDPEIFVRGISVDDWTRLRDDPAHPLEDKALRGQYPPGSTFKMITAAAAIMEGVATPDTHVYCNGFYKVGQRKFRCWKWASGGHGAVDLHTAIMGSCDTYFYHVGLKVGIDRLARYMEGFGLGRATGLGLNQEKGGLVPTEAWKLNRTGLPWLPGETAAVSIGQGSVLMTPIQVGRMVAAIANGGALLEPYIVEEITGPDGQVVATFGPKVLGQLPVSPSVLTRIQEGMLAVVEGPAGTARSSRIPGIHMAGKTGTAQVVRQEIKDLGRGKKKIPGQDDHAWFVGYAPFEQPEIVVVVLAEHGGHGGSAAAPVASDIMRWYLRDRHTQAPAGEGPPGSVAAAPVPPPDEVGD